MALPPCSRSPRGVDGEPKVAHFHLPLRTQHDVLGLDVAVQDALELWVDGVGRREKASITGTHSSMHTQGRKGAAVQQWECKQP